MSQLDYYKSNPSFGAQMFDVLCPDHVVSCQSENGNYRLVLLNPRVKDGSALNFNDPHHFQETSLEQEGGTC